MTDTIFCTCGQMTVRMEDVKAIQPLIIEHTAESSATWFTLGIVALICITVILVALISKRAFKEDDKKRKESKKENDNENVVNKPAGKDDETDKVKKEYTSKLANFLEDLSKNEKNSKMKDIDNPACQKYLEMLTSMAKKGNLEDFEYKSTKE